MLQDSEEIRNLISSIIEGLDAIDFTRLEVKERDELLQEVKSLDNFVWSVVSMQEDDEE